MDTAQLRRTLGAGLFEFVPDPIFLLDPDGVFLDVNPAAARYLGREPAELVGKRVTEIFPPEQAQRQLGVIREVVRTGEPFVEERTTPIGEETFVFQYAVRRVESEGGEPLGVLGMVRDVTALVTLERRYAELYEKATDALFGVDPEGRILALNREAEALSGYGRGELERLHYSQVVSPEDLDRLHGYFRARLSGGEAPTQYEARYRHGTGEQRWAEVHISRQPSGQGLFQASVRDVTARKRLEGLRRDFLRMISHDVKTPLTVIQGFASALSSGLYGEVSRAQRECLDHILEASRRVRRLMEQFLLAERVDGAPAETAEPGPVRAILEGCVEEARAAAGAKGVGLELSCELPDLCLVADGEGLRHVMDNLVSNAVKYTPAQGRVSVRASWREGEVHLRVEDTGAGIPERERSRVFERFFRGEAGRGEPGTGLGLYIVRGFVERAGGRVTVESEPGRGSCFTVTLPTRAP
ncbi:MAG: ATP-binding protein [Deferrisomatales bacterium]